MSTYKCTNCFGTFEGIGIYSGWMHTFCPQCALIKQQEKQYEEQCRIDEDRERQRREEEDRRYWEDRERQNAQRPVYNNGSRGIDLSNPEHFERVFNIFVQKLEKNRSVGQDTSTTVVPRNNNFKNFAKNTSHIDTISKKDEQISLKESERTIKKPKSLFSKVAIAIYYSIALMFSFFIIGKTNLNFVLFSLVMIFLFSLVHVMFAILKKNFTSS